MMEIGEALRLLRTRHGLTQADASKREGAPGFRSLSDWENGRKTPNLKLLFGGSTAWTSTSATCRMR